MFIFRFANTSVTNNNIICAIIKRTNNPCIAIGKQGAVFINHFVRLSRDEFSTIFLFFIFLIDSTRLPNYSHSFKMFFVLHVRVCEYMTDYVTLLTLRIVSTYKKIQKSNPVFFWRVIFFFLQSSLITFRANTSSVVWVLVAPAVIRSTGIHAVIVRATVVDNYG